MSQVFGRSNNAAKFREVKSYSPSVRITIIGHTDRDGSLTYNQGLSKRRSMEVAKYLRSIGMKNQVNIDWKGEDQVLSTIGSKETKAINRRVTIELDKLKNHASIFTEFRKEPEVRTASTTEETIILFKNGTQVTIKPEDLKIDESDGPIQIAVEEYYKKADFVLSNLTTTTTKGELLESKGMIHIQLTQNGRSVALKPGKTIPILFPDQLEGDKTILFTGVIHNDDITWKVQTTGTLSGRWSVGKSYIFDENKDTIFISKERMIMVDNEAFREKEYYEKGILVRIDTTSMANEIAAMQAINASTELGWINCDKFYESDVEKVDFLVQLPKNSPAHVMLVFKEINSVINYSSRLKNQYIFSNVPTGMEVEIIALVDHEDKIDFGRKTAFTGNEVIELGQLREISIDALPDALIGL